MIFDYSDAVNNIQLDKLLSELLYTRNSHENLSLYLLFHPINDEPEADDLMVSWQQDNPLHPITYVDYKTKRTPALIGLDLTQDKHLQLLKHSLKEALTEISPDKLSQFKPRKIYGWLFSSLSVQDLALQLGYLSIQPRGTHKELLRYFDPSILPLFMSILNDNQRDKVLRPICCWLYVDGDGQMSCFKNQHRVKKHITPELAIDPNQWSMIDDIEVCNQILIRYRKSHIASARLNETQYNKRIWTLLQQAKNNGYRDQQDLLEYGYFSLVIHPDVMQHYHITQLKRNSPNCRLKELFNQLSAEDWQTIKNDLEGKNNGKL